MAGGRGTRLDAPVEKPLFEVAGRPMVDRVLDALEASRVESVRAAVSPHVPETRRHLIARSTPLVETPGEGYVEDLGHALADLETPVLTVVADLPLLDAAVVDRVLDAHEGGSMTVCVPVALKERLGASVDLTIERDGRAVAPAGINIVSGADEDRVSVIEDERLAVNVNRRADARVAERLR